MTTSAKKSEFVHLHNHSHYSILDGACTVEQMVTKAKEFKMDALAITDHGNMFGAVDFYQTALKAGIKPIIGCEVYVAAGDRREKGAVIDDDVAFKKSKVNSFHLVLLAKNKTGYDNLMKLCSIAYLEGFYYRPRVDKEVLALYHEGLIAMSACIKGELAHLILTNQYDHARETADFYRQTFGADNYYLELMNHGMDEELKANEDLIRLGKDMGIPLVATNDLHYIERQHAFAQDVLICIQTQKKLNDTDRLKFSTEELYFKSPAEMERLFARTPEAISNTLAVAEKCHLKLEFGQNKLPDFPLPAGSSSIDDYLEKLTREGVARKFPVVTPEIQARMEFELKTIKEMKFPGYFLIVMDFVREAKRQGVPVGPGRGSAAGSLVSYALDITNVDPLKYDLFFERFLNPHRVSMPDIDIDFSDRGRAQIIKYVIQKYGERNVCQIITFGTMAARAAIRDVARVMDVPYAEADRIAKLIPGGPKSDLTEALKEVTELKQLIDSSERYSELYQTARNLEGINRNVGTHAAGVVIAPAELDHFVPLYKSGKDEITTQYDMDAIGKIGLLKMDFLGLRTLTVLQDALALVKLHHGVDVDLDHLQLDDPKTFELFANAETVGVFQFESTGMRDYLRKLKPSEMNDLIAMNALYRPGPMGYIDDYIHRKHGVQKVSYDHPLMESVLKSSYGIIVYQEQVMQLVAVLAGFTLAQADEMRRAMGKKKAEIMNEQRELFMKGCAVKKINTKIAEKVFDDIYKFAEYAFNKAHSTGYAIVAYQTAYLKANYPAEFMAATLTSEMDDLDRVIVLIDECKRMGLKLLPPDINESMAEFTVTTKGVRFGLRAIKNVGQAAIDAIIAAREKYGKLKNIHEFCEYVDLSTVNKRVVESLVLAGAMDSLEGKRWQQMAAMDSAMERAQVVQNDRKKGQTSLFDSPDAKKDQAAHRAQLPDAPEWPLSEILKHEKELLGFYVSGHPLAKYEADLKAFTSHAMADLSDVDDARDVRVGGIVLLVNEKMDRKGQPYAFLTVEDFSGSGEALVFSDTYAKFREHLVKESLVFLTGKASTKEKGNGKVIVNEVVPLAQVRKKMARFVAVTITTTGLETPLLESIKEALARHPGKCPVMLDVVSPNHQKVRLRTQAAVNITDKLLDDLKKLAGSENVKIG